MRYLLLLALLLAACSDGAPPTGSSCPAPAGPGVEHAGTITTDQTWTAAQSPHVVTFGIDVRGATLTLEPCAVVRVRKGYSITIGESSGAPAKLIARGSAESPITITSDDPAAYWGTLGVMATGMAELEHVVLDRAGDPDAAQGYGGALKSYGDDNRKQPVRNIRARSVRIQSSATLGINLQRSGGFSADSTDLVVTGSGSRGVTSGGIDSSYPVYVEAPSIKTLPPGDYTGNARDAILARTPFVFDGDETFHERGVPYQIVYTFDLSPAASLAEGGLATLTIEPGVTIKLGGPLYTTPAFRLGSSNGSAPANIWAVRLVADGTADRPITFTSGAAVPASGDWVGLKWAGGPETGNVMNHVRVEYGGADSTTKGFGCGPEDNDALLVITNWRPGEPFVRNSTFAHSATGGIVSGWNSAQSGPDFRASNTFTNIAEACQISVPRDENNKCPGNDLTPDCY